MADNRIKILLLLIGVSIIAYSGLIYISASTADFKISATLTEDINLVKISAEKSFPLKFDLEVIGVGIIASSAEDFYADVYVEDVFIGTLETPRASVEIPTSGKENVNLRFYQDLTSVSESDFRYILNSIEEHGGELFVEVVGDIKPNVLFFSLTKDVSSIFYLVDEGRPVVSKLVWAESSIGLGDSVEYEIVVKNVYRGLTVEGFVSVDVLYDTYQEGSALDEGPSEFFVSLDPGEVRSFSRFFSPSVLSRYVLSCEWNNVQVNVDNDSLRLRVYEGTISLVDVFWEVDGNRVSTAQFDDIIEAHVILRAISAGVSDYVIIKIVKDLAWMSDIDYISKRFEFFILSGETEELVIPFSPHTRSGSTFRWYLIEIHFSDGSSWMMEQLSPPRLKIV